MKPLLLNDISRLVPQRPGGFSVGRPALLLAVALALPLTALSALSSSSFGDGAVDQPQAYALRLPLTLAPGASLQRLALPAQVLVNLQTPNYSDLRIFNAQGQPVAMALARAEPSLATRQQRTLMAYPVLGPATAAGLDGLSLRIEERQGQRVVQINTGSGASTDGTNAASVNGNGNGNGNANGSNNAASPATPAPAQLLGALLDARAVSEPLVALALQADLPEAQPVTFTVQASRDLSHWRPLGQTVLFRAGAAHLGESDMALDFADIKDCYVEPQRQQPAGRSRAGPARADRRPHAELFAAVCHAADGAAHHATGRRCVNSAARAGPQRAQPALDAAGQQRAVSAANGGRCANQRAGGAAGPGLS